MTIDLHNHIYQEEFFDGISARFADFRPRMPHHAGDVYRFEMKGVSYTPIWANLFDVKRRLEEMDRLGIDMQALSVVPFLFWYQVDPDLQIEIARAQNDHIAAIVREHPKRFVGVATVPLGCPEEAVAELDRAVKTLSMRAVEIGTNVNGKYLDDRQLRPFFAKAQELDVPVFIHPQDVAAADRLAKYYTINTIGNPLDTTIAAASLIFGGVLAELPGLRCYLSHGGGFVPYQRGRFEHAWEQRSEPRECIQQPPSKSFSQLYFDTITHYQPALQYLVETAGAENVILGTDYPFDMQDFNPVQSVLALDLSEADKRKVLHDNAARLLKIG